MSAAELFVLASAAPLAVVASVPVLEVGHLDRIDIEVARLDTGELPELDLDLSDLEPVCLVYDGAVETPDSLCSITPLGLKKGSPEPGGVGLGGGPGPGRKAKFDAWAARQDEFFRRRVTRLWLIDNAGMVLPSECGETLSRWRHIGTGDQELRPHSCNCRGSCPTCAITYGRGRGATVLELFGSLLTPGRLLEELPNVKARAYVLTLPACVSEHLDGFVMNQDKDGLRVALQQLTGAVQGFLVDIHGAGVASSLSWHWWHSKEPLNGSGHWHVHVLVPNISVIDGKSCGVLERYGLVSEQALELRRQVWASKVSSCSFIKKAKLVIPDELSVHYKFFLHFDGADSEADTGAGSLSHRCRYDYRHPMADFDAHIQKNGLPENGMSSSVQWFLQKCAFLQGIQLVRYTGWLVNVKRKQLGLVIAKDKSEWEKVSGFYIFESFTDDGVVMRVWHKGVMSYEFWPSKSVRLMPLPRIKRFEWRTG